MTLEEEFRDIDFDKMLPEYKLLAGWVFDCWKHPEEPKYIIGKSEFKKNPDWKEYLEQAGAEIEEGFEKKAGGLFGVVNNEFGKNLWFSLEKPEGFATLKKKEQMAIKRSLIQKAMVSEEHFAGFLSALFKKFLDVKPDVKHFSLNRSPSQMVEDFRWVMRNSIEAGEKLLSAKDINQKSKVCSQWSLGKNVEALDYLLGRDIRSNIRKFIPDYYAEQLFSLSDQFLRVAGFPAGKDGRPAIQNKEGSIHDQIEKLEALEHKTEREIRSLESKVTHLEAEEDLIKGRASALKSAKKKLEKSIKDLKKEKNAEEDENLRGMTEKLEQLLSTGKRLDQEALLASHKKKDAEKNLFKALKPLNTEKEMLEKLYRGVHKKTQGLKAVFSSKLEACFSIAAESMHVSRTDFPNEPKAYQKFVSLVIEQSYRVFGTLSGPEKDFLKACEYEAINNLVTGELHKLDPVNGDASCQFRVPFVYDLHKAVVSQIDMEKAKAAIDEYNTQLMHIKEDCVSQFMKKKSERGQADSGEGVTPHHPPEPPQLGDTAAISARELTKEGDNTHMLQRHISGEYVVFKWNVEPYRNEDRYRLPRITGDSHYGIFYREIRSVIQNLSLTNMTSFDTDKDTYLRDMWWQKGGKPAHYKTGKFEDRFFHHTSTLRYLTLCKALTVKQMSFCDTFYMTVYQNTVGLPFMTEDDCRVTYMELAWYSTCYVKNIFNQMVKAPANKAMLDTGLPDDGKINAATFFNDQLQKTEWYFKLQNAAGPVVAYYENKRMLYMYLFIRKIPIIVDMRRIICEPDGYVKKSSDGYQFAEKIDDEGDAGFADNFRYEYSGGGVYYFEANHELGRYVQIPADMLTAEQKAIQGLNIDCYSMFNTQIDQTGTDFASEKDYTRFEEAWLQQTDLIDQILITTMAHVAATGSTERPADDTSNYLRTDVKKNESKSKKKKGKGKELPAFTKLVEDDVISLYGLPLLNSDIELPGDGKTPATDLLMPQAEGRVKDLPLDLTGKDRGYLQMFANSFNGKQWDILQERAFIKALSHKVSYNGYLYQRATNEAKTEYERSKVTYLLTCRHLYVSTYGNRMAHFQKFKDIVGTPEGEWKVEHPFTRKGEGILALDFLD